MQAKAMFCEVEHNVNELTSADIHVGARGETGPTVFTFSQCVSLAICVLAGN